ncbi:MAG: hypothetical protein WBL72_12290, partial [Thermoguttaceae bacterium]
MRQPDDGNHIGLSAGVRVRRSSVLLALSKRIQVSIRASTKSQAGASARLRRTAAWRLSWGKAALTVEILGALGIKPQEMDSYFGEGSAGAAIELRLIRFAGAIL